MTLEELKNEIKNYQLEGLRANANATKQAKSDRKMIELLLSDIDFIMNNENAKDFQVEKLNGFNLGVYACEVAKMLVAILDNKNYKQAYTNNHDSNNYNKVSNIKTYISSKPSGIGKNASLYTYVYYCRTSAHMLVRYNNIDYPNGYRFVVSDIPNGKIIKQF